MSNLELLLRTLSLLGADVRDRTGDLVLTKDALCQLSYIGPPSLTARCARSFGGQAPSHIALRVRRSVAPASRSRSHGSPSEAARYAGAAKDGAGDGDRTRDQQLGRL